MEGDIAVDPDDHDIIYYQTYIYNCKVRLRSGQRAELIPSWGTNGIINSVTNVITADFVATAGLAVYNDLVVFSHEIDTPEPLSELVFVRRSDGSVVRRFDLSTYYVLDVYRRAANGGNYRGVAGPFAFTFRGNRLYTTSFHAPVLLCLDAETGNLIWRNGNGDGYGDKFNPAIDPQYVDAAVEDYLGYYYHVDVDRFGFCYYPDNLSEQEGERAQSDGFHSRSPTVRGYCIGRQLARPMDQTVLTIRLSTPADL